MRRMLAGGLASFFLLLAVPMAAQADDDQRQIVTKAELTLSTLEGKPEIAPNVRDLLSRARGIMIFPVVLKGAFFIGGEGGSGVLLAKNADGSWSYPAFYTMGSVSFGLQIGGQSSEIVVLIMNDSALKSVLEDQVKVGGDVSAAIGPAGAGASASTTTALGADLVTYSAAQGLFIGASIDGAVIGRREDWNHEFYNAAVTPKEIVIQNLVSNPVADPLRRAIAQF